MDHTVAVTTIGTIAGLLYHTHPYQMATTALYSLTLVSPLTWYFKTHLRVGNLHHHNIFYENDCTKEEISRFRAQDEIENLGQQMLQSSTRGYISMHDPRSI